jgi:hypothetical protein
MTTGSSDVAAQMQYAGDIAGRARFDIVDLARMNLVFEPHEITIRDVRSVASALTLETAGFEYVKHESEVSGNSSFFEGNLTPQDFAPKLSERYMSEVAEFLRCKTGAKQIFPQLGGLVMRTSNRAARKSWALPANFVHLDYTAVSAPQFLRWSADAAGITLPSFRRFVAFQTWRAVSSAPQDSALAICDGRTVGDSDSVVFDSVLGAEGEPGKVFEARFCRYGGSHQWYYLSDMAMDDLLLFKGFDSDIPHSMNAMHSAFDNPLAGSNPVARRSVEARFMALYD